MASTVRRNSLVLIAAIISLYLMGPATNACAQTGARSLDATMGTLVIDRGSAALLFNGQRYSLSIQGATLTPATADTVPFVVIVYNLRSPIDIVGTYVTATSTDPADHGAKTILLQNSSGVVLRFDIKQESETPSNLDGLIISMR